MSFNKQLKDVMGGYNPMNVLLDSSRKLVNKWEPTGLLEGIEKESEVAGMAVLLENQARQLIDEASQAGTSANQEQWSGVALPLVRRIFAELSAQEFVSVQPMNLPSGLIFYLDFKYGSTQQGGKMHAKGSDLYGNTSSSGDPTGGVYGAGKWGYSINDLQAAAADVVVAAATAADVRFDTNLSASAAAGDLKTVSFTRPAGSDLDGVKGWAITASGAGTADNEIVAFYPAFTTVSGTTVTMIASGSIATADDMNVKYHAAPTETSRGDFETSFSAEGTNPEEPNVGIPEVDIEMKSIPITAKSRKLKAVWTPELAQDLNAYHAVDAEAELTAMLSEYVTMEIDLEIIDMLKTNASAKTENWTTRVGNDWQASTSTFVEVSANASAYTKGEWFQTLGHKIQSVSNAIHKKTLRGGANFIVVSPEVATILESIPGFATDSDADVTKSYAMGVQKIGMLTNRFNVYKNPYLQDDQILCGFRGAQFLETGAVYAPYVPMILTPVVYDPTNFTPRRGVMTRYAKKMVRSEFYGLVNVAETGLV